MMSLTSTRTSPSPPPATEVQAAARSGLQRLSAGISAGIALVYGLLYLGILSIEGASEADRGILGVAAGVFVVLAVSLWRRRNRLLWVGAVALQLLMGGMYLAIAPERDPSFEVWGLTIRALSLVLVVTLVGLLASARRRRMPAR